MDELKQQVADLENQEMDIEFRLQLAETDEEAKSITNELNFVRNRKAEVELELSKLQEKEQQRAEVIEEKAHATEIPFAVAGIDFTELPSEVITLIDAVVKADRRRLLNEHAIELEQVESKLEELTALAESQDAKLLEQVGEIHFLKTNNEEKLALIDSLTGERDEARVNRDNAARLLEEANKEIARLKSELEDIKRAQEYNNRQSEKFNANDDEKATINAALEAVKKLYVKVEDYGSIMKVTKPDGTFELAKRQEVAEEWAAVDVPSFRPEYTSSDSQDNNVSASETAASVEPPQFHTEEPTVQTNILLRESTTEGLGDVAQVTREEFEALEKAVDEVYNRLVKLEVQVNHTEAA